MFTNIKLVIGLIVAVLIAVAVFIFIHRGHEVAQMQQQAAVQQVVSGGLQQTIVNTQQSSAISENTQVQATQAAASVVNSQDQILLHEQAKEAEIHHEYASKPPAVKRPVAASEATTSPDATVTAEAEVTHPQALKAYDSEGRAISTARLDSLWQSWCQAKNQPNVPECQARPAQ